MGKDTGIGPRVKLGQRDLEFFHHSIIGGFAQGTQVAWGVILAGILAAVSLRLGLLTRSGATAAFLVGAITFGVGGGWAAFVLLMFFGTSNALGRWRKKRKAALGFEKGGARDAAQVGANGGAAAFFLLMSAVIPTHGDVLRALFMAALAEANADTWATEVGAASGATPRLATTGRLVSPGQSGGVSWPGTIAAASGSLLIALCGGPMLPPTHRLFWIGVIAASGLFGAVFDSVLGATVQAQYQSADGRLRETPEGAARLTQGIPWLRNDAVNFLATLAACALAALGTMLTR